MMLTPVAVTGLVLAVLAVLCVGHLVHEQIQSERAYRKAQAREDDRSPPDSHTFGR
jgi:hypothetical protein